MIRTIDVSDIHLSDIRFFVVRADGRLLDFSDFAVSLNLVDHVNIAGMEADIELQGPPSELMKLGGEGTEVLIKAPLYSLADQQTIERELFRGTMEDVVEDRIPGDVMTRTLTCYDIAQRLATSHEDCVFVGKTLSQIVSSIVTDFSIPIHAPLAVTTRSLGNIIGRGTPLWDTIQQARQKHYDLTGELWRVRARAGRLELMMVGGQTRWWLFEEGVSLQSVRRQRSLSEVVNVIKVYGEYSGETDKPPMEATITDAASQSLYGRRQRVEYVGSEDAAKVKEMATRRVARYKVPQDRVTVSGWMIPTLRAGEQIKVTDKVLGMDRRTYYVESMEARWSAEQGSAYAECLRDVPDPDLMLEETASV
jgi:hypothetical protein